MMPWKWRVAFEVLGWAIFVGNLELAYWLWPNVACVGSLFMACVMANSRLDSLESLFRAGWKDW